MSKVPGTAVVTILVVAFAAYVYFFEFKKGIDQEQKKDQDALLFSDFKSVDINHVELVGSKDSIVLDKKDQVWKLSEPIQDLADAVAVDKFLNSALHEKTNSIVADGTAAKSAASALDFKTFGLDQPAGHLLIKTPQASQELKLGSVKAFNGSYYARIGEERQVRSVAVAWEQMLDKTAFDFREKRLYRESKEVPWDEIQIFKGGKLLTDLKQGKNEWQYEPIVKLENGKTFNIKAIHDYLQKLKDLRAIEFVFENSQPTDEKGFKLDKPYLLVTLKDSKDKKQWSLKLSQPPDEKHEVSSIFAASSDTSAIARVFASAIKTFDKGPGEFIEAKGAAGKK